MAINQGYYHLWFESFRASGLRGHRHQNQLRLLANQALPSEIAAECTSRQINPFTLLTECNSTFFTEYPAGTRFLLKAKLSDRKGKALFFYSSYAWSAIDIIKP
jgi:hypothetical protein